MSTLHFDKQGSFSTAVDLTMVLNESTNNLVPIAQKVGYEFDGWFCTYTSGGHVEEKVVRVYSSDEPMWEAKDRQVIVYEDNTWWEAEYIPQSDTPVVVEDIKVFDSHGRAVKSDIFWSDDYPNGVYKNRKNITVYPVWHAVPFVNEYFDNDNEKCHLYTEIDGVMTRVEVFRGGRDGS